MILKYIEEFSSEPFKPELNGGKKKVLYKSLSFVKDTKIFVGNFI
jgi:hypothetical protein